MVRLVYVLILFQFIVRCSAVLPLIELTVRNVSYVEYMPLPRLIADKPFLMKINSMKKLIGIRCYSGDYQKKYFGFDLYYVIKSKYYAPKDYIIATEAMNDTWRCLIDCQPDGENTIAIIFKVYVERAGEIRPTSVIAEPAPDGPQYSGRISTAKLHYFDVRLYRNGEKTFYKMESMIEWNKTFTVSVYLAPHMILSADKKMIRCNNINRYGEVYFHQPIYQTSINSSGIYTAQVPAISTEIAPIWGCEIFSTPKLHWKISFTCTVTFKLPPAHRKPDPPKPGDGNLSTPHPPPPSNPGVNNGNLDWRSDTNIGPEVKDEEGVNNENLDWRSDTNIGPEVKDEEANVPSITLNIKKGSIIEHQKYYILYLKESFEIRVENMGDLTNLNQIICYFKDNDGTMFVNSTLTKTNRGYTATINKAEQRMEAEWKCYIFDTNSRADVTFEVGVINKREFPIEVRVNNVKIDTKTTTLDNFVASGKYMYHEGELAKITCSTREMYLMSMEYMEVTTSLLYRKPYQTDIQQTMYVKLTEKQQPSYIQCIVNKYFTKRYNYILRLDISTISSNIYSDYPMFNVNGLSLTPVGDSSFIRYEYEYYDTEELFIKGSVKSKADQWSCNLDTITTPEPQPIENQYEDINLTVTLPNTTTSALVTCMVGTMDVHLTLVSKSTIKFDPAISGLSSARTLLAYKSESKRYITKYSHFRNKSLQLTCTSKNSGCEWAKDGNKVNSTIINEYDQTYTILNETFFVIKYLYEPLQNESSTRIECNCSDINNTATNSSIVYIINDHYKLEAAQPPDDPGYMAGSERPGYTDAADYGKDQPIKLEIIIGIITGTMLVVILVIWIIVGIHKRKRKSEQTQQSDINYENLPEHNEGAMPMPAQWNVPQPDDAYTYAVPYVPKNIEDMYSKPQPKGQRQPAETLYAEVGHGEPNHAEVATEGGNGPKTEYANLSQKQPTPMYGQIKPKKLLDNARCALQVLPKLPNNENYAQVLPKSMRQNVEASKYENVFEHQRYANIQAKSDYAEPAYCEVNVNKK